MFNGWWWWIFTGLAGFFIDKMVVKVGFSRLCRGQKSPAPKLLLLRVFSLGKRSERLFDALGKHWLRAGSVRMIAGPDLATSTVEPHEFLNFLNGKLARRFIDGSKTLDLRLQEMDTRPDCDGRSRVTDFFGHDDTWKMVLARLIAKATQSSWTCTGSRSGMPGGMRSIDSIENVRARSCRQALCFTQP